MHGKFEQARALARQYRMKSQNLEKEQAELKEQLAAKQAAVAATAADESSKEEVNKLTQQLQAAQNELDQYKQVLLYYRLSTCCYLYKMCDARSRHSGELFSLHPIFGALASYCLVR